MKNSGKIFASFIFALFVFLGNLNAQYGNEAQASWTESQQIFEGNEWNEFGIENSFEARSKDLSAKTPLKLSNFRTWLKEQLLIFGLICTGAWLFILLIYLLLVKTVVGAILLEILIYSIPLLAMGVLAIFFGLIIKERRQKKRHFLFWTW